MALSGDVLVAGDTVRTGSVGGAYLGDRAARKPTRDAVESLRANDDGAAQVLGRAVHSRSSAEASLRNARSKRDGLGAGIEVT